MQVYGACMDDEGLSAHPLGQLELGEMQEQKN